MAAYPLIPELQTVLEQGSEDRRASAARKIATLFVAGAGAFREEHVRLFDDVLVSLSAGIGNAARQDLAQTLAPIGNAPARLIRILAADDDILVAGPVLAQSTRLSSADLLELAETLGEPHLLALAARPTIETAISDILIRRGEASVWRTLTANAGAAISESAFAMLLGHAVSDADLAEALALRGDIPEDSLAVLITRMDAAVRQRVLLKAGPEIQARLRNLVAQADEDSGAVDASRDFTKARQKISAMAAASTLDETQLAVLAQSRAYEEMVSALSVLTLVPVEVVDRLMMDRRPDAVLILCKAAGYSWPTARDIVLARPGHRGSTAGTIDTAYANFDKLPAASARRVVRFWQMGADNLRAAG